jgi:uncharacterized membrane protein
VLAHALAKESGADSNTAKAIYSYNKSIFTIIIIAIGLVAGTQIPILVIITIALSLMMWAVPSKRIEKQMREADTI